MKITYKNYIIENDRNGYIFREMWIKEKWNNIWEVYEKDIIYPSTLEKAILAIFKREKLNKNEKISLEEYINELKKMEVEFLKDISELAIIETLDNK